MSEARFRGSFWPSPTQELLLKTALSPPDAALAAWETLAPELELLRLEPGTASVLPLVYRFLSGHVLTEPRLERLKGTYRSTWVKNNLLAQRLAQTSAELDSAGIAYRLVGGLGAAARYYPEFGLRPTPTLDLLIAPEQLTPATRALGRLAWASSAAPSSDQHEPLIFSNADGQTCILRTTPGPELEFGSDLLRSPPIVVPVARITVTGIAPEDDFVIACVSGARSQPVRSVQWLVDLAQIILAVPDLNWDRILDLAAANRQTLRLQEALRYLSHSVLVPEVPAGAMGSKSKITMRERIAYACAGTSIERAGNLPQAMAEHLSATAHRSWLTTLLTLPTFLRRRWRLEHGWQLPAAAGRRAVRSLGGRGSGS